MDDLFVPLTPPNPAAPQRPCSHRKDWRAGAADGGWTCRCGHAVTGDKVRAGRRVRSRGLAIQRQNNREAGLRNVAGNVKNLDGRTEMFRSESKSGGAFPERLWRWLRSIPAAAGQVRVLIVRDTPGRGHRSRAVVVVELADWVALHGTAGIADPLTLEDVAS